MKKLSFTVNLEFNEKLSSDDDVEQVAKNIAEALKHAADTVGISPDEADFYTTSIEVKSNDNESVDPVFIDLLDNFTTFMKGKDKK